MVPNNANWRLGIKLFYITNNCCHHHVLYQRGNVRPQGVLFGKKSKVIKIRVKASSNKSPKYLRLCSSCHCDLHYPSGLS